MQNIIQNYIPTTIQPVIKAHYIQEGLHALVNEVALSVLIDLGISLVLSRYYTVIVYASFMFGFIRDGEVRQTANKVRGVYDSCETWLQKILLVALVAGSLYFLPCSVLTAAIYYPAKLGALLAERGKKYIILQND